MASSIFPALKSDSACSIADELACGFGEGTCPVCAVAGWINVPSNRRTLGQRRFIRRTTVKESYSNSKASQEYPRQTASAMPPQETSAGGLIPRHRKISFYENEKETPLKRIAAHRIASASAAGFSLGLEFLQADSLATEKNVS